MFLPRFCSRVFRPVVFLLGMTVLAAAAVASSSKETGVLPVTTKSPQARRLFESGLVKMQNLHDSEAMDDLRKAVALDPDFALANALISFESMDSTVDPAEKIAARERAKAARAKVSHGEQLVIDWLVNSSENRMIPAIQAMNTVTAEYQNDKFLAWLGAVWMENQEQLSRAIPMFERLVRLEPKFAPPLNELGYCYARTRNFDKAFATMQRYIALLPNESNPHDSYAEILRMAGRFDDALVHYRESLKIDPGFVASQLGIADTYALMGQQARARSDYALAIQHASSKTQAATWGLQSATTYVREKDYAAADNAFRAVAQLAHENDLAASEAEAYRMMASYQTNTGAAMKLLTQAEQVLEEKHQIPQMNRNEELANVLRTRAFLAARDGDSVMAAATLKRLQELAGATHDHLIEIAYEAAQGAALVAQGKYEDALAHLQEDNRSPLAMQLMVTAYSRMGAKELAQELSKTLAGWNEPTLEQALVAPEFREKPRNTAGHYMRM